MKSTWRFVLKIVGLSLAVAGLICVIIGFWDGVQMVDAVHGFHHNPARLLILLPMLDKAGPYVAVAGIAPAVVYMAFCAENCWLIPGCCRTDLRDHRLLG